MKYLEMIIKKFIFVKIILSKMINIGNTAGRNSVQIAGKDGLPVSFVPSRCFDVTPSDTIILMPGILYVGTGGDVVVRPANQPSTVTFVNVPNGTWLPVLVDKVMAATGASDILICY